MKYYRIIIFTIIILIFLGCKNLSFESSETTQEETVKLLQGTIIYDGPGLTYNEKKKVPEANIVTRIEKGTEEIDGYMWDKIKLINGEEGYVKQEDAKIATNYKQINVEYGGKEYELKFLSGSSYPYRVIAVNKDNEIGIYWATTRMKIIERDNNKNSLSISSRPYSVILKNDGFIHTNYYGNSYSVSIDTNKGKDEDYGIIESNHDLTNSAGDTVLYKRNIKYNYDNSHEGEKVEEIVSLATGVKIYEAPGLIYNEIMSVPETNIVTRIRKGTEEIDGHMWDKIKLINGEEGYVKQEDAKITTDYEQINVEYGGKEYELRFLSGPSYPYRVIAVNKDNEIGIYWATTKMKIIERDNNKNSLSISSRLYSVILKNDGFMHTNDYRNSYSVSIDTNKGKDENYGIIETNHDLTNSVGDIVLMEKNNYLNYFNGNSKRTYSNGNEFYLKDDATRIKENEYDTIKLEKEELVIAESTKNVAISLAKSAHFLGAKDAGNNLLYFLTKGIEFYEDVTISIHPYEESPYLKGHTAKELNFENAVRDVPSVKDCLYGSVNEMMDAIEHMPMITGDKEKIYCHNEIGGMANAPNLNWYLGIYQYRTRNSAVVNKISSNKYKMQFKHLMVDYYDWENKEFWGEINSEEIFAIIQSKFSDFNKYGISRNYTNYDILDYTVTWDKGQRIDSGATIEGPGL